MSEPALQIFMNRPELNQTTKPNRLVDFLKNSYKPTGKYPQLILCQTQRKPKHTTSWVGERGITGHQQPGRTRLSLSPTTLILSRPI